jgi:hypothetical protein
MKLESIFVSVYGDLGQGLRVVRVPSLGAVVAHRGRNGATRMKFRISELECVAEFSANVLQVNLSNGQPLATIVNGELVAFENKYRHLLF